MHTTASSLGWLLLALAEHPDVLAELRNRPDLARTAYDEVLRLETPIQGFARTVRGGDILLADKVVPDGSRVWLAWASANRDEAHWGDAADQFRLDRRAAAGHLTFGAGIHSCLGQSLARLQAEAVIQAVTSRAERLAVDREPTIARHTALRSLDQALMTAETKVGVGG